jgi:hypothetical protein
LIELAEPLPSNGKWSPVRITPEIVSIGDTLIAVGWGYRKNDKTPGTLQKIQLNVGLDHDCRSYPEWDGQDGEFVCTIRYARGICFGDGGGPLVLPTSPDSDEDFAGYLVGISSFFFLSDTTSQKCEDHSGINYFTRVAKHVDWIANVTGVNSAMLLANSASSFLLKRFDGILLSITPLIAKLLVVYTHT